MNRQTHVLPVLVSFAYVVMNPLSVRANHFDDPSQAVEGGRQALDSWWGGYPWYDRQADDLRRIDAAPNDETSWLESFFDWLDDRWNFDVSLGNAMVWVAWMVIAVLAGLIVVALIRAYLTNESYQSMAAHISGRNASPHGAARVDRLPFSVKTPDADLLGMAAEYYRSGNFNDAIVYLYSFLLLELDKGQCIRLTRGKTNRQYLSEVRTGLPEMAGYIQRAMQTFEVAFFGRHNVSRLQFEACWNGVDEFRTMVGGKNAAHAAS